MDDRVLIEMALHEATASVVARVMTAGKFKVGREARVWSVNPAVRGRGPGGGNQVVFLLATRRSERRH